MPQSTSQWWSTGPGQPNWYKAEYKHAKQENREADYRWGPSVVTYTDVDGPQPQCAAAAMMHGTSMTPASSYHGGCPTIAEHQKFTPFMQPPELTSIPRDVIVPNPGYKIEANLWNLNAQRSAREPSPLASLLRHCNTMESPDYPTYSKRGAIQPADDIGDLNRNTSIENLRELQKYSEKLHFEATCCRLWSEGIQFTLRSCMNKRRSNLGSQA